MLSIMSRKVSWFAYNVCQSVSFEAQQHQSTGHFSIHNRITSQRGMSFDIRAGRMPDQALFQLDLVHYRIANNDFYTALQQSILEKL